VAKPKKAAARPAPEHAEGTANPYLPHLATVVEVITETPNIKTFRLVLKDEKLMESFHFEPGQVGQLSMFGSGESTFVINSPPTRKEYLQFSVMRAGKNTTALHSLVAGDTVGVRAPLGNHFPYDAMKGKDLVFIGGGIGMAPLRTLMLFMLDNRKDYGKISLLYGARSPADMAFSYELPEWIERDDLDCVLTIDREAEGWEHRVGLIPNVLLEMAPAPKNCIALTCGPPIMIKFTLQALEKLGFAPAQIYTTLERRMKCGIGICGRCNIGDKYVCIDGPVFSLEQLKAIPNEL
jgi:2-polyprenylphenol hydroxylase and related flavodoxin oxidoreductases